MKGAMNAPTFASATSCIGGRVVDATRGRASVPPDGLLFAAPSRGPRLGRSRAGPPSASVARRLVTAGARQVRRPWELCS